MTRLGTSDLHAMLLPEQCGACCCMQAAQRKHRHQNLEGLCRGLLVPRMHTECEQDTICPHRDGHRGESGVIKCTLMSESMHASTGVPSNSRGLP